jgi:hypothetical protein
MAEASPIPEVAPVIKIVLDLFYFFRPKNPPEGELDFILCLNENYTKDRMANCFPG